jgi:hypothetical protein
MIAKPARKRLKELSETKDQYDLPQQTIRGRIHFGELAFGALLVQLVQ